MEGGVEGLIRIYTCIRISMVTSIIPASTFIEFTDSCVFV